MPARAGSPQRVARQLRETEREGALLVSLRGDSYDFPNRRVAAAGPRHPRRTRAAGARSTARRRHDHAENGKAECRVRVGKHVSDIVVRVRNKKQNKYAKE